MKEDKYITYLKQYKDANGDINTIPRNSIVLFEGETLKIGEFIASIRKQHRLYLAASSKKGCQSPLAISRYQALDELDFGLGTSHCYATTTSRKRYYVKFYNCLL